MQPEVANALAEAANLLLVGMVVVFSFLSMLIGAINLIAWLNKLVPDPSLNLADKQFTSKDTVTSNEQGVSPRIVSAITAAIKQHRQ